MLLCCCHWWCLVVLVLVLLVLMVYGSFCLLIWNIFFTYLLGSWSAWSPGVICLFLLGNCCCCWFWFEFFEVVVAVWEPENWKLELSPPNGGVSRLSSLHSPQEKLGWNLSNISKFYNSCWGCKREPLKTPIDMVVWADVLGLSVTLHKTQSHCIGHGTASRLSTVFGHFWKLRWTIY